MFYVGIDGQQYAVIREIFEVCSDLRAFFFSFESEREWGGGGGER